MMAAQETLNHFGGLQMKNTWILLTILVTSLLVAACNGQQNSQGADTAIGKQVSGSGGTYLDITVTELQSMLKNKDFVFVNTHIPFEGDIPDTDLSIPYDQIENNLDKLPADKNAKIVLYCRSDRMSSIASETLAGLGYTNVWNLEGGMVAWEAAGLPLEG
jgi:rhodanese-related sulfurtransferase